MEQLIQQLEESCQQYQSHLSEKMIFTKFITDDESLYRSWEVLEDPINSVCGTYVQKGQLTFQCFTCAQDPSHMYCHSCFDISHHIGKKLIYIDHKCIMLHNISGCCDCGDEQRIRLEGFCNKHQGLSNLNQSKEIFKISIQLQNNVRNFIKAAVIVYLKYMKQVEQNYHLHDVLVTQYYYISQQLKIQQLKEIIDEEINIEPYFQNFSKALYLHNLLFRMITWLTQSRLCFIILITSILQEQLTQESNQSIIEDIIEYQAILETQGPYDSYKLKSLICSFHANDSFKFFFQQCYLKQYQHLWLITFLKNSNLKKEISEHLKKLKEIPNAHVLLAFPQKIVDISKTLKLYIQESKKLPATLINIELSGLHELHYQFASEKFLNSFLMKENIFSFFQMNRKIQDIIHQNKTVCSSMWINLNGVLKFRFEYFQFEKFITSQIQQALTENYQDFTNKSANLETLKQFSINDFVLTAYIQSFSTIEPVNLDSDQKSLTIQHHDLVDVYYYLIGQSKTLMTVQLGLNLIFKSKNIDRLLKQNVAKLILFQCYDIIKNRNNTFNNVDAELNTAYEKYIHKQFGLESKEHLERLSKIYLLLIKSSTFVDKVFTMLLCYVYNEQQFLNPNQFLSYLLEFLEEDSQVLQQQLSQILSRCVQNHISIQFCQHQVIQKVYFGLQDQQQQTILESYDSAFLKIYLFLFDIEGYEDFQTIFKGKHLPNTSGVSEILSAMQLRLLSTDIDMYNVCGNMFEELPNELMLSFAKVIQNFYNISVYLDYSDIEEKLISIGISVTENLPKHILQICELDKAVKKLKLKPEYKKLFDPAIFQFNRALRGQIIEKLIEGKSCEPQILLGDGIKWDVEQFSNEKYRNMLYYHLKFYSAKSFILKNLQLLKHNGVFPVLTYQLLYIQIIAAKYFRNQELIDSAEFIKKKLSKICQTSGKDDIQRLKILIQEIDNCTLNQELGNHLKLKKEENSQQLLNCQNKYRAKYQALQDSQILNSMIETLTTSDKDFKQQHKTDSQCSYCKLNLDGQEACAIIFLSHKPSSVNFQLPSLKEQLNIDISITNCKHYFHKQCFLDQLDFKQHNDNQYLSNLVKFRCPVCKQASKFTLPLVQQLQQKEIEDFNTSLLLFLMESNAYTDQFLENEKLTCQLIIHTYYSLIFDLLIQLFSHPQEFARNEKFIIFQQLIKLLLETAKLNFQWVKGEQIHFGNPSTIVYQFLSIIEVQIVYSKNLNEYHQEAIKWLKNLGCNNELKKLLCFCLEIPNDFQNQLLDLPQVQQDETILCYGQLYQQIQETIISKFGDNFEKFYFRYFPLQCSVCKFYNINQIASKGAFVCILCSQVFCQYSCSKTNVGNLNQHAQEMHNGNSLYICLQTGDVTLLSYPISISKYLCLYYNKLGQKIDIEQPTIQWNDYVLDQQRVRDLSNIILYNTYESISRNLEVRQDQLDLQASI